MTASCRRTTSWPSPSASRRRRRPFRPATCRCCRDRRKSPPSSSMPRTVWARATPERLMRPVPVVMLSAALAVAVEGPHDEACATAQHHEFDFVVGNWLVRDSLDHAVGTATIAKAYGGCVLIEAWQGVGSAGQSLGGIGYGPESRRWHRDFLDPGGVVLSFEGARDGLGLVMTGKDDPADG